MAIGNTLLIFFQFCKVQVGLDKWKRRRAAEGDTRRATRTGLVFHKESEKASLDGHVAGN